MNPARRSIASIAALLAGVVAACQPLPHPFEDDRPPASLLHIRDMASVSIAPIEGAPAATAARLAPAVAQALLKRDIVASDKTTSLGSYYLYGRIVESRPKSNNATVTALWRLYDAHGRSLGEHTARLNASRKDWDVGKTGTVERLAALSAERLAPLLQEDMPAAAPAPSKLRLAIQPLKGAPGDGDEALARAVATVLQRQNIAIVEAGQPADLTLNGEVSVARAMSDKQHVKVLWHMRRADGGEIGTVGQENDVPRGLLDGPWGDVAYMVAMAAGDGLMQLVARGAPTPKS